MDPSNQLMTVSSAAISQTHPSVRIRGTENNYHPMQCADPRCPNKTPHMHCPFCQKTEVYQDPVILKAHYRVKHVDKGIDFAGLKILRCCDHCDIVGAIKGEKKFKGAHWHCYKCKNGFNRRDEAIKHYKTHFRNPQTTFQIQITQEVNSPVQYYESQEVMQTVTQDGISTTIHPVLTEAIMSTVGNPANSLNNENDSSLANGRANEPDAIQVSVAANETVGSPPETQAAIMIIHEEHMESGSSGFDMSTACQTILKSELEKSEEGKKIQLEHPLNELQNQYKELEAQYSRREQQLQSEINQLKIQLQLQNQQIASLKKREEDLLQQMNMPIDARLQELLAALQMQHVELLQQQLLQVKRAALTGQIDAANLSSNQVRDDRTDSMDGLQQMISFFERVIKLNGTLKTALKPLTTPLLQQTSNQTVVALVVDDTTSLVPVSPSSFSQTLSPAVSRTASLATNSDVTDSPRSPTNLQNSSEFNNSKVPTGPLVIVDLTESSETSNKREAEELADSLVQKKKK